MKFFLGDIIILPNAVAPPLRRLIRATPAFKRGKLTAEYADTTALNSHFICHQSWLEYFCGRVASPCVSLCM